MFDLLKKLENYKSFDENEEQSRLATIEFLKQNTNCYDRSNKNGHITAGALVCDANGNILLNHHKITNMWFQFGGHSDGSSNSFEVAKREVFEESGIRDFLSQSDDILDVANNVVDARPEKDEPQHTHYDINFLFITKTNEFKISEESSDIKWVSIKQAKKLVSPEDISIKRMIAKYELWLKNNK